MRTWTLDEGLIRLEGVGDIIDWWDIHAGDEASSRALCQFIVDACNEKEQRGAPIEITAAEWAGTADHAWRDSRGI